MYYIYCLNGLTDFSLFQNVKTSSGALPATHTIGTGSSFSRGEVTGLWSWPPPSSAKVKNDWSYNFSFPVYFYGVQRNNLLTYLGDILAPSFVSCPFPSVRFRVQCDDLCCPTILKCPPLRYNGPTLCIKKCKIKVKFTLEEAPKAQRGSRGIALLFL